VHCNKSAGSRQKSEKATDYIHCVADVLYAALKTAFICTKNNHMERLQWNTEQRKVSDLIPLDFNPRKRNEEKQAKLVQSINDFNLVEIPVINLDNRIVAGQRRYEALYYAGRMSDVIDVRVPNRPLTEDEVKRYNLISNTHAGEWDFEKLEAEFAGIYRDIINLPDIQVQKLHDEKPIRAPQKEVQQDTFNQEPPKEPVSKEGDLYELNRHRLLCGDSTDPHAVKMLMGDTLANMAFTDPPYNVKIDSIVNLGSIHHEEFKMASGEMNRARFTRFLSDVCLNLQKFTEQASIHYICMDWKHVQELIVAAATYSEFKNLCVWNKSNAGMGAFYRSKHELIFVFKNGKGKHINNFGLGDTGRYRTNVWDYAGMNDFSRKERGDLELHPTVKPVKLVADAILDCSNAYHVILDLFIGSGTTIIAAEQTNRLCYGVELDPKYCDVAIRRWVKFMRENRQEFTIKRNGAPMTAEQVNLIANDT
jgi:DNA modification methylase